MRDRAAIAPTNPNPSAMGGRDGQQSQDLNKGPVKRHMHARCQIAGQPSQAIKRIGIGAKRKHSGMTFTGERA